MLKTDDLDLFEQISAGEPTQQHSAGRPCDKLAVDHRRCYQLS